AKAKAEAEAKAKAEAEAKAKAEAEAKAKVAAQSADHALAAPVGTDQKKRGLLKRLTGIFHKNKAVAPEQSASGPGNEEKKEAPGSPSPKPHLSFREQLAEKFKKERPLGEALTKGKFHYGIRFRFEDLNNGIEQDNSVITLRSFLGYTSRTYRNFSLSGEIEDIREVGGVVPGVTRAATGFDSVGNDPDSTELNKAFLKYEGLDKTQLYLGRQGVVLGDGRFVSNEPWRQNERTYDAFRITSQRWGGVTLEYLYINGINTTLGGNLVARDHVFHALYPNEILGDFEGTILLLNNEEATASDQTFALQWRGNTSLWLFGDNADIYLKAKAAVQTTEQFQTNYYHLSGDLAYRKWLFRGGLELLGSDTGQNGFEMPLGENHAFNGWNDVFSVTPDDGLINAWVGGQTEWLGLTAGGDYHQFASDFNRRRYGREIDLVLFKAFDEKNKIGIKMGSYHALNFSSDLSKFWFWFSFRN
ncbi:MAG: hypothetical protein D6698_06060, partial [Gammaproteobacteria bacterium]